KRRRTRKKTARKRAKARKKPTRRTTSWPKNRTLKRTQQAGLPKMASSKGEGGQVPGSLSSVRRISLVWSGAFGASLSYPPRGLHAARIRQAHDSPQGLSCVRAHPEARSA